MEKNRRSYWRSGAMAVAGVAVCAVLCIFLMAMEPTSRDLPQGKASVAGTIAAGAINYYYYSATGSKLLCLDTDSSVFSSPCDTVVQVLNPSGVPIASNDNGSANFSGGDSAVCVVLPTYGRYTIQVWDAAGAFCPYYILNVTTHAIQNGGNLPGLFQ